MITSTNANGDPCDPYFNILLNPNFVSAASGNFNLLANSPCIDAGDPLNPPDPDGTIADIGAYFYEQSPPPDLEVTLTPQNPPIQIPANGGSFLFNIIVENIGTTAGYFDFWIETVLPSGTVYGPLLQRNNLYINIGGSITRNGLNQVVPAGAPAGTYTYVANAGDYPNNVVASDEFDFEKLSAGDGSGYNLSWNIYGWDGECAPIQNIPAEIILIPAGIF